MEDGGVGVAAEEEPRVPGYGMLFDAINETQRTSEDAVMRPARRQDVDDKALQRSHPGEAPRASKCASANCNKKCGPMNTLQQEWSKAHVARYSGQSRETPPRFIHEPVVPLSRIPQISDFCQRPLILWDPQSQYKLDLKHKHRLCDGKLEPCGGEVLWKEWNFRVVQDVESAAFLALAKYRCKNCSQTLDSYSDFEVLGVPSEIMICCPVILFQKTALTTTLADQIYGHMTKSSSAANVKAILEESRTSRYLKKALLWRLHVNSSKSRSTLFGSSSSNKAFQDFPSFHDHCTYNGTLGLSQDFITKIFNFLQET